LVPGARWKQYPFVENDCTPRAREADMKLRKKEDTYCRPPCAGRRRIFGVLLLALAGGPAWAQTDREGADAQSLTTLCLSSSQEDAASPWIRATTKVRSSWAGSLPRKE